MSETPTRLPAELGHEEDGTNVTSTFRWIIILIVLVIISVILSTAMHAGFLKWTPFAPSGRPVTPLSQLHRIPPQPRLQSNPTIDMTNWRATEQTLLTEPGWMDPQAGTVRLPIERAMELVAQEGLPARKGGSAQ